MCLTEYSKMEALDYDEFVRRIQKYRDCHIGILSFKRVLQSKWAVVGKITIKIKTIDISSIEKKNKKSNVKDVAAEENNDGEIAETKDSILNLPAVVSAPTTDNIMKHTEVDEPAVRNGVVGGADVTEGDMEVVEAGERREDAAIKSLIQSLLMKLLKSSLRKERSMWR